jgi:site-specific DNA recombinase
VPGQKREWIPGNHEPIIEHELFDQCQEVRKVRAARFTRGRNKQKSDYLLDMLICVECGTQWVGWKVKGVRKYRDPATDKDQVCHQSPKYINADVIEQKLIDVLFSLKLPDDWQERILQRFSEQKDTTPMLKHRVAVEGRLTRLRELYISGDIPKDQYEQRRAEFERELGSFVSLNARGVDLKRMAELVQGFADLWALAKPGERKKLLQLVYRNVYIERGEIKAIEPTELLWVLLDSVMIRKAGRTGFEPAIRGYPRITA